MERGICSEPSAPPTAMVFVPEKDAEPIAGYRLVEKLGVGGYGEVWKATAPGGLTKAIKIIYGDMAGARAEQELKALGRIKEVRHPFLLSLERFEILGSQLFIVTEVADGCLQDRFYDCRKAGMKGIPRDELLVYLRDAAEALDYMSETHGLQHLDIKPQNLLFVGGRIKVADFGLVKELVGTSVTATGGVTPVYATPEAFDGRVSRYSDQYSLAIVYQEMLTGVRPFPGTTMMQLAAQHMSSPPLVTPLPPSDRAVIAKALSKSPEQRFPSCLKMVETLLTGGQPAAVPSLLSPTERGRSEGAEQSQRPADPDVPLTSTSSPVSMPAFVPSVGMTLQTLPGASTPPPQANAAKGTSTQQRLAAPTGKPGLRPTLFLGIGGLAGATLRRLRKRLHERFGGPAEAPIFRLLLIDTDREDLRRARQGDSADSLDSSETLLAPLHLPEYYRPESKKLLRWLDRRWFYGIPRSLLTEGLRPLGRLALVDNAANLLAQVRETLSQITSAKAIETTLKTTGAELREESPRVFVVASATGGTGGGMALSMAYVVRQALDELSQSPRGLCGVFLFATSPKPADQEMARINAYATLSELDHFSRPGVAYPGDPDYGLLPFGGQAPFEESYLLHLGEQLPKAEVEAAADLVAEYLALDATATGGAFFDQFRRQTHTEPLDPREPVTVRSFGLSRIGAPGERPVDLATNLLCRRLTEKWSAGPGEAEIKYLEREAQRQVAEQGLEEGALLVQMQNVISVAVGEAPEAFLNRLLSAAAEAAQGNLVRRMLPHVDAMLGTGPGQREGVEHDWSPFQLHVNNAAEQRGAEISRALVEWLIHLVEVPGRRFKAADRLAAFLSRSVMALADATRPQLNQARAQCHTIRQQIITEKPGGKASGIRWLGISLGGGAPDTDDKLANYCQLRLCEVALENALVLLGVVQGELNNFTHELVLCRQRLGQFAAQFRPTIKEDADEHSSTPPLPRIGGGANGPVNQLAVVGLNTLPPKLLFRFDRTFQTEVLQRYDGLWGVFSRPSEPAARRPDDHAVPTPERLKEDLLVWARSAIYGAIQDLNSAQLFLQSNGGPEQSLPVLLAHLDAARPRLRVAGGWEHLVLVMPEGPAGNTLGEMVTTAFPDVPVTVVHTDDEVLLCYEAARYPLREMAASLLGTVEVPFELVRRVMTRLDVSWSLPEPVMEG
jgi:serine/threonine protein kinase